MHTMQKWKNAAISVGLIGTKMAVIKLEHPSQWNGTLRTFYNLGSHSAVVADLSEIDRLVKQWYSYYDLAYQRKAATPRQKIKRIALEQQYKDAVNGIANKVYKQLFWQSLSK